MKFNYLEAFKKAGSSFTLTGNKLLIERIEVGEAKTKGGIIIAEASNVRSDFKLAKAHMAVVLAVGQGYFDAEDKKYVPLEVKVGDIVILNQAGAQYFSLLPGLVNYSANTVGITTEADVQMRFSSAEDYNAYVEALKSVEV